MLALAEDLPRLWEHPETLSDVKKRLLRTAVKEIVVTSEGDSVHFIVHWQGGDHTELWLKKTPTGRHSRVTSTETIELITSLARLQHDERIAATINRLGHRTAHGQTWTAARVCAIRKGHGIAAYREGERQERSELTVDEAAAALQVTHTTVLRLIRQKDLAATQACRNAPWTIRQDDLDEFLADRAGQRPSTRISGQLTLDTQVGTKQNRPLSRANTRSLAWRGPFNRTVVGRCSATSARQWSSFGNCSAARLT